MAELWSAGVRKFENWTSASSVDWKFLLSCWEGVGGPTNNLFRPNSGWSWIGSTVGLGCDNTYLAWKCIQLNIGLYFIDQFSKIPYYSHKYELISFLELSDLIATLSSNWDQGPPSAGAENKQQYIMKIWSVVAELLHF